MSQQINDFIIPDFQKNMDNFFTELVHNVPIDLLNYIKQKLLQTDAFFKNKSFELQLIADTNILFSEVRSLMLNNSSFFLKIADNPFIKIYAPTQLKQELFEKIKVKFPKEAKTRNLNLNDCYEKAEILLSKIQMNDNISNEAHEKAKSYLQQRDEKDISFVALNFTLKTHGVLTKDKDIIDQKEVKTWLLKDAGKILTEINKGTISFMLFNLTAPTIWEFVYQLSTLLWQSFIIIVESGIKLLTSLLNGSVKAISNMPPELALLIGFASLTILIIDELRENVSDFTKFLWEEIKKIAQAIKSFFNNLWDMLKTIVEALKPLINVSAELLLYLTIQSGQTFKRLEDLEKSRPA